MSGSWTSFAAEPITPRGMVAFAYGTFKHLFIVQLLVALLAGVSVLLFFDDSLAAPVDKALNNLSGNGKISNGHLVWPDEVPKVLAEERVLALNIDLSHTNQVRCTSDVQIEFGSNSICVYSLPGRTEFPYPDSLLGYDISVSRDTLVPIWGAWMPEIQALLLAGVVLGLLVVWTVLATVYWLPIWLVSLLAGRDLSLLGSWRLAGASLLPGALLLTLAFVLFNFGILDMVQFAFVAGAHVPLAWLYLFASLFFLPPRGVKTRGKNPFETADKS